MNDRVVIGEFCELTVTSQIPQGFYLVGKGAKEAFLPIHKSPDGLGVGSTVKVFIHTDRDGKPLATTATPHAVLGGFASLRCTQVNAVGAFLDWGLPKELFAPFAEQHRKMVEGRKYVVVVLRDKRLGRMMASSRLAKHFDYNVRDVKLGQEVSLLVYGVREGSAQVVVEGKHAGLLYVDSSARRLQIGDALTGFVKALRPDNKVEVTLTRGGRAGREDAAETIVRLLKRSGGRLPVHDKSPPETIAEMLQLSKKGFKRAAGSLLKARVIRMTDEGIELVSHDRSPDAD